MKDESTYTLVYQLGFISSPTIHIDSLTSISFTFHKCSSLRSSLYIFNAQGTPKVLNIVYEQWVDTLVEVRQERCSQDNQVDIILKSRSDIYIPSSPELILLVDLLSITDFLIS